MAAGAVSRWWHFSSGTYYGGVWVVFEVKEDDVDKF